MRCLIISASMGAGHDGVARELGSRLSATGDHAEVVDMLDLLPFRLGAGLRRLYSGMVRFTPWLYELVYRVFFVARRRQPTVSPVVLAAMPGLRREVARYRPDVVVSTFHLAAQAVGRLRTGGGLDAPAAVVLVDFAVHRLWLHPGCDLFLCSHPAAARAVRAALGRPARSTGPVVPRRFHAVGSTGVTGDTAERAAARRGLGLPVTGPLVVLAGGSLGMGSGMRSAARAVAATGRYVPVVLCGRNERLRRALRQDGVVALGWVDDVPSLFGLASVLVENGGGGLTCAEAFAAGLPVVTYRPIPGHGRAGAHELASAGLSILARCEARLLDALDTLTAPAGSDRQVRAARALFTEDPAVAVAELGRAGTPDRVRVMDQPARPVARSGQGGVNAE
ncbi:MAG TPA: glycosyltransferase [Mycobacteriales bacterium]|nr:glycosyltransferase [Mycobacteriales bacterium]